MTIFMWKKTLIMTQRSGYSEGELIRHYMEMPLFVTLIAALIGNILGYTAFKELCVTMYYGSYSLPTV